MKVCINKQEGGVLVEELGHQIHGIAVQREIVCEEVVVMIVLGGVILEITLNRVQAELLDQAQGQSVDQTVPIVEAILKIQDQAVQQDSKKDL